MNAAEPLSTDKLKSMIEACYAACLRREIVAIPAHAYPPKWLERAHDPEAGSVRPLDWLAE